MITLRRQRSIAFTIIELMISIGIFAMIILAIYATWTSIIKGSRAAQSAAASVQRSRVAVNALESAFRSVQLFAENIRHYAFVTDTSGDFAWVSMVGRLSPAIPGFAVQGGVALCRISFGVTNSESGGYDLMMTHGPMLADPENPQTEPYTVILAKDVTLFTVEFWDRQKSEYVTEWLYTNQLPQKVLVSLATGNSKASSTTPQHVIVREVVIPSAAITGLQGGGPAGVGNLGAGGGGQPGGQPGGLPGGQPGDGRGGRENRGGRDNRTPNPFQNQPPRGGR
jgi:type II secretory pathway pseudopilin PulG